jgi:hypothetical protein
MKALIAQAAVEAASAPFGAYLFLGPRNRKFNLKTRIPTWSRFNHPDLYFWAYKHTVGFRYFAVCHLLRPPPEGGSYSRLEIWNSRRS